MTKAARTSDRISQIAFKQFSEKGLEKVTMRDLAKACDMSLGAFYYHFSSKEEIIQLYYTHTCDEFEEQVRIVIEKTTNFEERLKAAAKIRIDTFKDERDLILALSRVAVDPRSPLSPFSEKTAAIRQRAIALMQDVISGSDLEVKKDLHPYLPILLWLYVLGVVLYWSFDNSTGQKNTYKMINLASPLLGRLLRLTRLPMAGRLLRPLFDIFEMTIHSEKSPSH